MLFFPFKVDLDLYRFPFITFIICLGCIAIYYNQVQSDIAVTNAAISFCKNSSHGSFGLILKKVTGSTSIENCVTLINGLHSTAQPEALILSFAEKAEPIHSLGKSASIGFLVQSLGDLYASFKSTAPESLTAKLIYEPRSYKIDRMITAAFSHGSWSHLIGNLIFFFAFAATAEILIGSISFILFTLFLAVATNVTYSIAMLDEVIALPTLGLSGVVMGMIGLFTTLLPTAKIRCFLWFIIIFRIISIPAWILAVWYIGWDVYNLYGDQGQSNVNFVAHVSGAFFGAISGLILFRKYRPTCREFRR